MMHASSGDSDRTSGEMKSTCSDLRVVSLLLVGSAPEAHSASPVIRV
jgi:hypothetical protein